MSNIHREWRLDSGNVHYQRSQMGQQNPEPLETMKTKEKESVATLFYCMLHQENFWRNESIWYLQDPEYIKKKVWRGKGCPKTVGHVYLWHGVVSLCLKGQMCCGTVLTKQKRGLDP
ncbi:hypothetical protein V6N12_052037 [Hibiscus sabdariffa]|uniref:Uncharacterized protein n=1 Tax=Hibiscus sabdariffa TaxID=183260 RepID=A0ABR2GH27_9ROSI